MKLKKNFISLSIGTAICLASFTLSTNAFAQIDTIRVNDQRLNTGNLKKGMRQYMVCMQSLKEKKLLRTWLWFRNTQIETRSNEQVFITTQNWYAADTLGYRKVYSVNRVRDFAPIFHQEANTTKIKAFNWSHDQVVGADSIVNNSMKNFNIALSAPCFNWNLDIELFEMLPFAKGKTFAIPFYDAAIGKPAYTIYKVSGSEVISIYGGQKIDCWKLVHESDYAGQHFVQTFWISKKDREFLKEEDSFPNGYRYKFKMPETANNILVNFDIAH